MITEHCLECSSVSFFCQIHSHGFLIPIPVLVKRNALESVLSWRYAATGRVEAQSHYSGPNCTWDLRKYRSRLPLRVSVWADRYGGYRDCRLPPARPTASTFSSAHPTSAARPHSKDTTPPRLQLQLSLCGRRAFPVHGREAAMGSPSKAAVREKNGVRARS